MEICREGMALGEYNSNSDLPWLVHKTFIHHDLKGRQQKESEKKVMIQAQLQLLIKMLDEEGDYDEGQIVQSNNVLSHLMDK